MENEAGVNIRRNESDASDIVKSDAVRFLDGERKEVNKLL